MSCFRIAETMEREIYSGEVFDFPDVNLYATKEVFAIAEDYPWTSQLFAASECSQNDAEEEDLMQEAFSVLDSLLFGAYDDAALFFQTSNSDTQEQFYFQQEYDQNFQEYYWSTGNQCLILASYYLFL